MTANPGVLQPSEIGYHGEWLRNWRMPQHWKWVVAQTPSGRALNLFQWVMRGETGTKGYVLTDQVP